MKIISSLILCTAIWFSCSNSSQVNSVLLDELQNANIVCGYMIDATRDQAYDSAKASYFIDMKVIESKSTIKHHVSSDSMFTLFTKYFSSIDSAIKSRSPHDEFTRRLLVAEQKYYYNIQYSRIIHFGE